MGTGNSLEETANVGNSMSNTIQFTNTHTAFTTTGNVSVGKELTVTGDVTVDTDTLHVDSTNNRVGVGTTSPQEKLDVAGTAPYLSITDTRTSSGGTTGRDLGGVVFRTKDITDPSPETGDFLAKIQVTAQNAGSFPDGSLNFFVGDDGDLLSSPSMVIEGVTGNVGIGITNPRPTFEVYNSGLGTGVRNDTGKIFAVQSDSTSWTSGHALTGINMKANVGSGGRFLQCNTGFASTGVSGSFDAQFILYEQGTGTAEIAWNGGGADYAEYFEWKDGNPDNEDRVGMTVKLNGDKIELVTETDDANSIIGAISANPGFVGDNAGLKWKNKYLRDDFGRLLMEEYEVYAWKDENGDDQIHGTNEPVPEDLNIPEDRIVKTSKRRILNPEFDPNAVYVSRDDRKEWSTVGLVGKLRIRKDQPIHPKWILLRDISENVKEWLIK